LTPTLLILLVLLYGCIALFGYFFLGGFFHGAGFEPTPKKQIDLGAKLADLKDGMVVYDLGSGIGSVLLHLAKNYSIKGIGIEVDPLKHAISNGRLNFNKSALKGEVTFIRGNLMAADLSKADVVYVFLSGGSGIMSSVKKKAETEMKPGSKIISYVHLFKNWKPLAESGDIRVYGIASNISA
jgi:precorrin-6B methylase 2